MHSQSSAGVLLSAGIVARSSAIELIQAPHFEFHVECLDENGDLKWEVRIRNLVTRVGAADMLDKYFAGSAYTAAWYLGLIGATSYTSGPAKTDTSASHGGWTESTAYSQGARPTLAFNAAGTGSDNVDKAASSASTFSINGSDTIKGCFVITNSTKGGSTGTLYSAGTFTDRIVVNGDTLNVTPTLRITV